MWKKLIGVIVLFLLLAHLPLVYGIGWVKSSCVVDGAGTGSEIVGVLDGQVYVTDSTTTSVIRNITGDCTSTGNISLSQTGSFLAGDYNGTHFALVLHGVNLIRFYASDGTYISSCNYTSVTNNVDPRGIVLEGDTHILLWNSTHILNVTNDCSTITNSYESDYDDGLTLWRGFTRTTGTDFYVLGTYMLNTRIKQYDGTTHLFSGDFYLASGNDDPTSLGTDSTEYIMLFDEYNAKLYNITIDVWHPTDPGMYPSSWQTLNGSYIAFMVNKSGEANVSIKLDQVSGYGNVTCPYKINNVTYIKNQNQTANCTAFIVNDNWDTSVTYVLQEDPSLKQAPTEGLPKGLVGGLLGVIIVYVAVTISGRR